MVSLQPTLPALPDDILFNIFSCLDERSHLASAMLVRRTWYDVAERLQYSDITLRFPMFEDTGDGQAARCLRTLSTRNTAANAVRHLNVSGALTEWTITLFLEALKRTTGLLSLELRVSDRTTDGILRILWYTSCESSGFLPLLSAINTDDAAIATSVAQGRLLSVLGLVTQIGLATFHAVVNSLHNSTMSVTQIRLFIEVDNMSAAREIFQTLCQTFPLLSVLALQLQFPGPGYVIWDTFGTLLDGVGQSLDRLHSLKVLGLALIPDPIDLAGHYEVKTRALAMRIVDRFPQLHRVELRWHAWTISADGWTPVSQRRLLRLLDCWFYSDTRHRLGFARGAAF